MKKRKTAIWKQSTSSSTQKKDLSDASAMCPKLKVKSNLSFQMNSTQPYFSLNKITIAIDLDQLTMSNDMRDTDDKRKANSTIIQNYIQN